MVIFVFAFISWILLFQTLLLSANPLLHKVELTKTSTLSDYLSYAALNNPGLKAAFSKWKASLERVPQMKSLPNPQLTFAYFIQGIETRVGPQRNKIGIKQMFPWFGKLNLKKKAALKYADAKKQNYENLKLNLFYKVKKIYFEYYYVLRNITLLKQNVQLLKYIESVVETKYRSGITTYSDLLKIKIELDKLKDQLRSKQDLLHPLKSRFNATLNRPFNDSISLPEKILINVNHFTYSQLLIWQKKNNPELKSIDYLKDKEQIGITLAKKSYFPNFSLGLDYIITGEAIMPEVLESGKDPVIVMASIQLPLWFKKNRASVNQARARYRAIQNQKREKENDLQANLEMVYYRFNDAKEKIILYKDNLLPKAKQALNVSRSIYKSGNVDILNLIDSHRTLLTFELAYERAQTNYFKGLAELEMLAGKKLSAIEPTINKINPQTNTGEKK